MMRTFGLMFALLFCSGCDGAPSVGEQGVTFVPAGWQVVSPFAGGVSRPKLTAALPKELTETGEVGIDSPIVSYASPDLFVRFDYGAPAHPGCAPQSARCVIDETRIDGRAATASISDARIEDRPFVTVHHYFTPVGTGRSSGNRSSDDGRGLLLIVKCRERPACSSADRIVSTVRLTTASDVLQ